MSIFETFCFVFGLLLFGGGSIGYVRTGYNVYFVAGMVGLVLTAVTVLLR